MQSRDRYTYVVAARLQHELSRRDCEVIGVSTPASAFCCPASKKKNRFSSFLFLIVRPTDCRRKQDALSRHCYFSLFCCVLGDKSDCFFSSFSEGFWSVCCYGFIYMARAVSRESAGLHQLPSLTYNPSSRGTWLLKQKHHDDGWRLM